jgi:hypothetical protein
LTVQRDADGRAVAADWTGELGVDRFVEFPFVAVNPDTTSVLTWPTTQIYAGGEQVDWAGPEGSPTPVSATQIRAANVAVDSASHPSQSPLARSNSVAWIAVVFSIIALVVAKSRRR